MSTTQPIRDKESLQKFKNFYKTQKPNPRNYAIIVLGLNTALRISDILSLTSEMVYDHNKVREHIVVKEQKTGKINRILLNREVRKALNLYRHFLVKSAAYKTGNPYLFPSPYVSQRPLSRYQVYRMIRNAAESVEIQEKVSCHSLRKTFGYRAWKQGADPIVIMLIYNHSSFDITKRYLCIEQDDKDAVFRNIQL
mgnify:FL=1